MGEIPERVVVSEPEEDEERDRQHEDDEEHTAAKALAEGVADDDRHRLHPVSPSTAAR